MPDGPLLRPPSSPRSKKITPDVLDRRIGPRLKRKTPTKQKALWELILLNIGTAGFEPATPATPLQCATGLRHVPKESER
jgi:hypothetical protein